MSPNISAHCSRRTERLWGEVKSFRYVAVSRDRIEARSRIGSAIYLHEFLTDHQTSADGWVNYGREFGYAWIQAHWLAAPKERTLQRHMARLKAAGFVEVRRMIRGGMRVRLLGSAKFSAAISPPAVQLSLLGADVRSMRGKAVEKLSKSREYPDSNTAKNGGSAPPKMAAERS